MATPLPEVDDREQDWAPTPRSRHLNRLTVAIQEKTADSSVFFQVQGLHFVFNLGAQPRATGEWAARLGGLRLATWYESC